jgi:hypothetical protein
MHYTGKHRADSPDPTNPQLDLERPRPEGPDSFDDSNRMPGPSQGLRDLVADALSESIVVTPKEWLKDNIKKFIRWLVLFIIGLIAYRWALVSGPLRPLMSMSGILKELRRPTAVPEIFVYGTILFLDNTLIFVGYYVFRVGPVFRRDVTPGNILQEGAPLPRGFWRFYTSEILGTFLIPTGVLGIFVTGHGIITYIVGWASLALGLLCVPRITAVMFALLKIMIRRRLRPAG